MDDRVRDFTDDRFEAEVLGASAPVVVDFWAEWCAPCKRLSPVIDELAEELGDRAVVGKLDIDSNPKTGERFGISAIPTVLVFHGGEVRRRFIGLTSKDELRRAVLELHGGEGNE